MAQIVIPRARSFEPIKPSPPSAITSLQQSFLSIFLNNFKSIISTPPGSKAVII